MSNATALRRLETDLGELIATQHRDRDIEDYGRWSDDRLGFIRKLGFEPYPKQVEIIESVDSHALTVVRGANGTGKDAVAAPIALSWAYAHSGLAVITGPTQNQVEEILMRKEVARHFRAGRLPGELHTRALRAPGGGSIIAKTATGVSALTGYHDRRVLFIVTEAQGCDDMVLEAALACTTGKHDRILLLGNPLSPRGFFYRCSKSADWNAIKIPAAETPNVQAGKTVIPGLITREGVERFISHYGANSPFVRARIDAEFPETSEDGLISRGWLDAANERWSDAAWFRGTSGTRCSLDVARMGPDRTVLAIADGNRVREFVGWRKLDLMETVARVRAELEERGLGPETSITIDTVGLGGGVFDRLRELGFNVKSFDGGRRALKRRRFLNRRAEWYWHLRGLLEDGEIALPLDEPLAEELLATTWQSTPDERVQILGKDQLRSGLGRSPDLADALSMLFDPRPQRGQPTSSNAHWTG